MSVAASSRNRRSSTNRRSSANRRSSTNRRTILVVTGTRAEYGYLKPVLRALQANPAVELQVAAAGMHLAHEFGNTVDEMVADGTPVTHRIDMLLSSDRRAAMAKSTGIGIAFFAQALADRPPHLVLVCGDRTEAFAATVAATYQAIPVAHLFGGDSLVGANIDDPVRHAITKLAHIHLVATPGHFERVLRLGEERWRVHQVGSPSLDTIVKLKAPSRKALCASYGFDPAKPVALVLQHPTSIGSEQAPAEMGETLAALDAEALQSVVIAPNADAGGRRMLEVIASYRDRPWIRTHRNLPHLQYLSLMQRADVMVGNSSSGILEAPSFRLPVVNVGERELGRERANNVIDVGHDAKAIRKAIRKALSKPFQATLAKCINPYGDGKSGPRIAKLLAKVELGDRVLQKRMTY